MTDPTPQNGMPRTEWRKRRQTRRRVAIIAVVVVLLVVAAGGVFFATRGSDTKTAAAPKPTTTTAVAQAGAGLSTGFGVAPMRAATTKGGDIAVYATPDAAAQPVSTLSPQTEYTLPRTMLAFDQYQDWLHVFLPTRPNDATGWIKASDVTVSQPLEYQIKVSLADHTLTLLHNGAVEFQVPAATGTDENPTPTGTFFSTDPLDLATQPGTAYGVFAIGLSGHSNTLSEFAGGDGQIAVHGTNDPSTIGTSVSHGCVRVNNDVILKLAPLPLGTPVVIS
jgi:lipoprotein-anchoring transpeptidase ErfK/SrfK